MFLSYMTFYQARAQQIWKGFLRSLGIMELPFAGLTILLHLLFLGLHQLVLSFLQLFLMLFLHGCSFGATNTIPSPSSEWHAGNKCYVLVKSKVGNRMHSLPMLPGLIVQISC